MLDFVQQSIKISLQKAAFYFAKKRSEMMKEITNMRGWKMKTMKWGSGILLAVAFFFGSFASAHAEERLQCTITIEAGKHTFSNPLKQQGFVKVTFGAIMSKTGILNNLIFRAWYLPRWNITGKNLKCCLIHTAIIRRS